MEKMIVEARFLRLFIAVPIPPNVRRVLYETQRILLSSGTSGRYVPMENFHITLKFLGELQPSDLPALTEAMRESVSDARPIPLTLASYSTFPGSRGHTGHVLISDPKEELTRLYALLESALMNRGFASGRQRFIPHITLGRNMEAVTSALEIRPEHFVADSLVLYESRFHNGQMEYNPLHREVF